MNMRLRWFGALVSCFLATGLCRGQVPDPGQQIFEKEWTWNRSTEAFNEVDLENVVPFPQRLLVPDKAVREKVGDGLGPMHNARSCQACHEGGGASGVQHNVTLLTVDPRSDVFRQEAKLREETLMEFFPGLISSGNALVFNTLVHNASTREGYEAIREGLAKAVPGQLEADWFDPKRRTVEAIAMRPVAAGRYKTIDFYLSQRNSPALFGLNALNAVSDARLTAVATWQARATEGRVTGRPAGKFGWRGQVQSLNSFVSGACAGELGLNLGPTAGAQANDPNDPDYINPYPDMSTDELLSLQRYVAGLPAPVETIPDGFTRKDVRRGETIFGSIGCAVCHVPDLRPVSNLFSDLLLHDMGPELQAAFPAPVGKLSSVGLVNASPTSFVRFRSAALAPGYYGSISQSRPPLPFAFPKPESPQFPRGHLSEAQLSGPAALTWDAMQREWKTPPLWGVADTAPYLHDGRAATLRQAIEWHGGESAVSREKFERLDVDQQKMLLVFLKSLRLPTHGES